MAERRMFAKTIVLSDAFLDMPMSARCLYFTLGMFADDDGFINNPKSIMRQCGATVDDMNILLLKKFLLSFDDGVIVIKHWRIHNYIQNDRYTPTKYTEHKEQLQLDKNKAYTQCIQNGYNLDTQDSIGKVSIGKDSIEKKNIKESKHKYGEYGRVLLSDKEYNKLVADFGETKLKEQIKLVDEYVEGNNNKNKYSNFNLVIRKSIRDKWFEKPNYYNKQTQTKKDVNERTYSEQELNNIFNDINDFDNLDL